MRVGRLVGTGRTADVYAIDDAWVLRRYRVGGHAAGEAAVMAYLTDLDVPVPRVGRCDDGDLDSRTDLVMQ